MKLKVKAIFIAGPTASGKSELAIWLAKKINGAIIVADSRQVYKYLDVGSGKFDSFSDKKIEFKKDKILIDGVEHYLLNIASPRKNYSLGRWLKDVKKVSRKIVSRGKRIIFCGGTVLYLRAISEGWVLPEVKSNYKLRKMLNKEKSEKLWKKLFALDKNRALAIHPNNKRRIIRALEIIFSRGKVQPLKKQPQFELLILSPKVNFEILKKKILIRLNKRLAKIKLEVKKLRKMGLSWKRIVNFGLEYKWFGLWAAKKIDLKTAKEKCYRDIVNFAKRQLRMLRRIAGENIIWVKNKQQAYVAAKKFLKT